MITYGSGFASPFYTTTIKADTTEIREKLDLTPQTPIVGVLW